MLSRLTNNIANLQVSGFEILKNNMKYRRQKDYYKKTITRVINTGNDAKRSLADTKLYIISTLQMGMRKYNLILAYFTLKYAAITRNLSEDYQEQIHELKKDIIHIVSLNKIQKERTAKMHLAEKRKWALRNLVLRLYFKEFLGLGKLEACKVDNADFQRAKSKPRTGQIRLPPIPIVQTFSMKDTKDPPLPGTIKAPMQRIRTSWQTHDTLAISESVFEGGLSLELTPRTHFIDKKKLDLARQRSDPDSLSLGYPDRKSVKEINTQTSMIIDKP
jgi:hypothetical protein